MFRPSTKPSITSPCSNVIKPAKEPQKWTGALVSCYSSLTGIIVRKRTKLGSFASRHSLSPTVLVSVLCRRDCRIIACLPPPKRRNSVQGQRLLVYAITKCRPCTQKTKWLNGGVFTPTGELATHRVFDIRGRVKESSTYRSKLLLCVFLLSERMQLLAPVFSTRKLLETNSGNRR